MLVSLKPKRLSMLPRLTLLALLGVPIHPSVQAQSTNSATGTPPAVRAVRVLVGAKAESRNGAFLITDQRTTFYVPDDREVIVFFEWQGPKGKHHCEANARGPQGAFTVMSSFDYDSMQPRFGGHWKMPLSDSTPDGDWVFASKVDGQEAGEVSFHVVAGAPPSSTPKAAPLPSTGEIYKSGTGSSVVVEKLDADAKVIRSASGFFGGPNQVFTTFMAVDGAKSLRLRLPDGKEVVADGLLAWSRRQDWAVIAVKGDPPALKAAEAQSWNIGDPCYWFDVKSGGIRIFSPGQIVGVQAAGSSGDLLYISNGYSSAASGGPLLDARGNVIGILGGLRVEGLISRLSAASDSENLELYFTTDTGTFVPISLLPQSVPEQPTLLSELWTKKEMMEPVTNSKYVAMVMMRPPPGKGGQGARLSGLTDMQSVLHRSDGKTEVSAAFVNTENLKSTTQLILYDFDNRRVAAGEPQKLSLSRGKDTETNWELPLNALPAGIYRVDVMIGDGVAWRQYFKLAD